jgi:hypothetical protein
MAYAAALGAPVDRLDELSIAAAGLAARLKMSMQTAMMYLVRGLTSGRFDILTRYGLQLDKTKTKEEQFAQVLQFANEGFSKQIEMADTISGRLTQLKDNIGDAMEVLGKRLSERFKLKEIVDAISKSVFRLSYAFENLVLNNIKPGEFGLEGVAGWFDRIVERMLAIGYLIPSLWKGFKNIFLDWDNFKIVFGTILKESAILFVTVLREGLKGLTSVFDILAAYFGGVVEKQLLKIPFVRGEVMAKYGKMGWISDEDIRDVEEAIDWRVRREQKEDRQGIATDRLRSSLSTIMDQYNKAINNIGKQISETAGVNVSEAWEQAKASASVDFANALKGYKELTEMPSVEGRGDWKIGGAAGGQQGPQFTSFADFWKKMSQEASKKTEEQQLAEQKKIVANTSEISKSIQDFLHFRDASPIWGGSSLGA